MTRVIHVQKKIKILKKLTITIDEKIITVFMKSLADEAREAEAMLKNVILVKL